MKNKISVIIPAYNEEEIIFDIVQEVKFQSCVHEVIVVSDGSTDQTVAQAEKAGARVLKHPYNMGNGAAVKTGARAAKGDVFVFMDGDGQHQPQDIPRLVNLIDQYAMVVGARSTEGHATWYRLGANSSYNALASYVTGFKVEDLTSGFRAVRASVFRQFLYLLPNTFSYPSTITLALIKAGFPIHYISIETKKRVGKSKIKIFRDGSRFFLIILKIAMLFSPFRIFLPLSGLLFFAGLGNYLYTYVRFHRFTNMSALLLMMGVFVFLLGLIAEQISLLRMDRSEYEMD